jgi:hypothetical protein
VVEQIDASVVEWVRQPVARTVDDEHAPVPGQRRQDRQPLEGTVCATVNEQQRRPFSELEQLRLTLRPAHTPHPSVRRIQRKQRGLCRSEFPIRRFLHWSLLAPRRSTCVDII